MRALVLAVFLLVALPAAAAVRLPARVQVDADELTLADLAPGAPAEWAAVRLGPAPRPGQRRTLEAAWVRRRAATVGAELELPAAIVVERPGRRVERAELVEAVLGAVRARVGQDEDVRILSVGLPGPVPRGRLELRPRLPDGALPSPATVPVEVWVEGRREDTAWVRVEVFRGRPAVVLRRDVARGEVLTADDLEVRAAPTGAGGLTSLEEALGKRLRRSLRAGAVISPRDLEVVPVVGRGDLVRVVARVGGVTASTLGKALGSAGVGETVQVENLSSGRTVAGVVRDGGLVEVVAGLREAVR